MEYIPEAGEDFDGSVGSEPIAAIPTVFITVVSFDLYLALGTDSR